MLSVHCCAGYATIYTVASGHKEATINARRAEMLYVAACRVLRDRAAAPSQSVWASSAAQIRSMAQIGLACSYQQPPPVSPSFTLRQGSKSTFFGT